MCDGKVLWKISVVVAIYKTSAFDDTHGPTQYTYSERASMRETKHSFKVSQRYSEKRRERERENERKSAFLQHFSSDNRSFFGGSCRYDCYYYYSPPYLPFRSVCDFNEISTDLKPTPLPHPLDPFGFGFFFSGNFWTFWRNFSVNETKMQWMNLPEEFIGKERRRIITWRNRSDETMNNIRLVAPNDWNKNWMEMEIEMDLRCMLFENTLSSSSS